MFKVTYLAANKWGSTVEQTRTLKASSIWEARVIADRFMASLQSKGKQVYPFFDVEEVA